MSNLWDDIKKYRRVETFAIGRRRRRPPKAALESSGENYSLVWLMEDPCVCFPRGEKMFGFSFLDPEITRFVLPRELPARLSYAAPPVHADRYPKKCEQLILYTPVA
jgi:hypothetical protein